MIPIRPDWSAIVSDLYRAYTTYHAILNQLAELGVCPSDHAQLCRLRCGKCKEPKWALGAALLNLHAQLRAP